MAQQQQEATVYCTISKSTHKALMDLATREGVQVSQLLSVLTENAVRERLEMLNDGAELPPWMELQNYHAQVRHHEYIRAQLLDIAQVVLDKHSDSMFEELERLCVVNEYDVQVILNQAGAIRNQMTDNVFFLGGNDPVSKAARFLESIFTEGIVERPAALILAQAAQRGIAKGSLEQAKAKLGITSERRSSAWIWLYPLKINMSSVSIQKR